MKGKQERKKTLAVEVIAVMNEDFEVFSWSWDAFGQTVVPIFHLCSYSFFLFVLLCVCLGGSSTTTALFLNNFMN